jgi:hypothetical protein
MWGSTYCREARDVVFTRGRNRITSDEGFVVKILSARGGLEYSEGDRTVRIGSEFAAGEHTVLLDSISIATWEGPSGSQAVNDEERKKIVENVRRAFKSDGYLIQVL